MSIYQPYTYLIGWSKCNKFYYGVRFAKNCNPKDLWKTYFTSSKYVKDFQSRHGEPDIIQIRKTFNTAKEARLWEGKVLNKMNLAYDDRFLNKSNNHAIPSPNDLPKDIEDKRRKSISSSSKGRIGGFQNKTHSKQSKNRMSNVRKKFWKNADKEKMSESMKKGWADIDKNNEQNRKEKWRKAYYKKPVLLCPHCLKEGRNRSAMFRHHFDSCKLKPS